MGFGVGLAALTTTKPAQAVAMLAETGAADFTVRAVHCRLCFCFDLHTLSLLTPLDVFKGLLSNKYGKLYLQLFNLVFIS